MVNSKMFLLRGCSRQKAREGGAAAGLKLVPHLPPFIPVEPETLDDFIAEMTTFRNVIAKAEDANRAILEMRNRLLEAFARLKITTRWKASIGRPSDLAIESVYGVSRYKCPSERDCEDSKNALPT